jgi:hypothetical protein
MVEEGVDVTRPPPLRLVDAVHGEEVSEEGEDGHHAEDKALANGVVVEGRGVEEAANVEPILLNNSRIVLAKEPLTSLGRVHELK